VDSSPEAYCNTTDGSILRQVLPSFDQETTDFYRWKVTYTQEELATGVKAAQMLADFGKVFFAPEKKAPSMPVTSW